jgi:hypothetical protein
VTQREVLMSLPLPTSASTKVISNGSRAATFLCQGTTRAGRRAFIYAAPGLDLTFSAKRFAEYVARKGIAVDEPKDDVKPARRSRQPRAA